MRFDAVLASALYSSALFYGQVRADILDDDVAEPSTTSATESSTSLPIEKPTFTVSVYLSLWLEKPKKPLLNSR